MFAPLNAVDWAQLHAKAWGAAWPVALFVITPRTFGDAVGSTMLVVLCSLMLLGALTSAFGLIVAARAPGALVATLPAAVRGLLIEALGLMLMVIALLLYAGSQFALTFGPDGDQRVALVFFAMFVTSMVLGRIVSALRRRQKAIKRAAASGVEL
ncbi:hypothetical protein ACFY9N_11965 [Microbacterium sp. NPDC008134]|uniref:hypothetical protein n=1 Tax=Microbacterium sp. NPDC008134 TaxID=3364183 RepID=UPI0036EE458A